MRTRTTIATSIFIAAGAALVAVPFPAASATTEPPDPSIPPIAVEELTRVDEDTLARGAFSDATVTMSFTVEGHDLIDVDVAASNVAMARIVVQPGAQFPWHTHPGPVVVNVVTGELTYVMAEDCAEHAYAAGSAFVDPGRGNVHTAVNRTDGETVLVAFFTEVPADGPLTITEGVTAPVDGCGL